MTLTQRRIGELREFYTAQLSHGDAHDFLEMMSAIPQLPEHSIGVGWNALVLGELFGATPEELGWLSLLYAHDIGKPLVDDPGIFSSGRRAGPKERQIIKQHASRGLDFVRGRIPDEARYLMGCVHEKSWDDPYPRTERRSPTGRLEFLSSIPTIADMCDILLHPQRDYMDHRQRTPKEIASAILEKNNVPMSHVVCAVDNLSLFY